MSVASFSPQLLKASKSRNARPPAHLGTRFSTAGTFLREPGNTIICHVTKGSETQKAMVDARDRFLAMPDAARLIFTPVSSLHMTLFQGIIEYRRQPLFWPADLPLDTPIDAMTGIMQERLARFSMREPFHVTVTGARPAGLLVDGVSADDRRVMRAWRDALADLLGYRHPDHDHYPFHITFDYLVEWLEDDALPNWQHMLDTVTDELRERIPVLQLDPPAFCAFDDMNHFEERLVFDFDS